MESFIIYIAKASGLIALFIIAYYALLRKETFFIANRGFLLAGLLTATLLPFAHYNKVIWVDTVPEVQAIEHTSQTLDLNRLMQLQQQMMTVAEKTEHPFTINWWYVSYILYAIGVLFFFSRLIIDFIAIRCVLKGNAIIKEGRYKLIDSKKVSSPFSFFNYIVYNSTVLNPEELESIISHEKVHSRQRHSADMIISQLFCIVFWFNPFAWLYKKSISQNLEFIADAVAIKQLSDKKAYQKTLLKITLQPECIAITNHFYQSLIKKRIVMLNKKQSKRLNSWKYTIVLPVLAAFMLAFQVKVVAQEKTPAITSSSDENTKVSITITKDTNDEELAEQGDMFKEEFDADVTFSDVKRNASGEITSIKVNVKDKNQSKDYMMLGNGAIKNFNIEIEKNSANNNNIIFFGDPGKGLSISGDTISYASNTNTNKSPKIIALTDAIETDSIGYAKNGNVSTNIYKGALVVVDGKKQEKDTDITKLQFSKGQTIGYMNVLSPKDAKKKYGREAKKGAVEITTKKVSSNAVSFPANYSYNDENGTEGYEMPPMPPMPPMEDIMSYAMMGVDEGMKALSEIDWQEILNVEGLSDEDRNQIREEMKRASIEARKAMNDPEVRKSMDAAKSLARGMKEGAERGRADKQSLEAKKEYLKTQKEIFKAKMELAKLKMEIEKNKQKLKNKSN